MKLIDTVRGTRNIIGESPISDDSHIYWVDAEGQKVFKLKYSDNSLTVFTVDIPVTAITLNDSGGFILAAKNGIYRASADFSEIAFLCKPTVSNPVVRINDAVVSPSGDLWFGTMNEETLEQPDGCIYVLRKYDGALIKFDEGYSVANGIAFNTDGSKVYISNMFQSKVVCYELDSTGLAYSKKTDFIVFAKEDGLPDGLKCDTNGNLYVCFWDGHKINKYNADGDFLKTKNLPAKHVTRATFYGIGLSKMAVTSGSFDCTEDDLKQHEDSGYLFQLDSDENGLADVPFIV